MVAAVASEANRFLLNSKVEKIYQPEKDLIMLYLHGGRENYRLLISAGANNPRINITEMNFENPKAAPMFCMLLRKHLVGARIAAITQLGFERVVEIKFDARDDLGFETHKYLIAEIMGKHSNIIFCTDGENGAKKIVSSVKVVDFTTSSKRQVLPGMTYEMPPPQNKICPLDVTSEKFAELYDQHIDSDPAKFITGSFSGLSNLTAGEIAYRFEKSVGSKSLWDVFSSVMTSVNNCQFAPVLVRKLTGEPLEYSFMPIEQYGGGAVTQSYETFGQLIDEYYGKRESIEHNKQRTAVLLKILTNIESRNLKKIQHQRNDLIECEKKDSWKLYGDLITGGIYKLKKGMDKALLDDWSRDPPCEVEVSLDPRLTPSQNAQLYYKKYSKAKTAEIEIDKQITLAERELVYVGSVIDSLTKVETEDDLNEIRYEMLESGFISKNKANAIPVKKAKNTKFLEFKTDGGYKVLCGKNNYQNDLLSFKTAEKTDYWFHAKNIAGSHVVMLTNGEEPSAVDFTQAAAIAAFYSKAADGVSTAVDYTQVKNLRKPNGSQPGFVIYYTNFTAYVASDESIVKRLRV
jgi:predicted ribosome quality control (RQC) complex YloA/Tae2 family protein